jgi:Zn-dependent protease
MGLLNTLQTDPQAGIILIIALVFSLSFHEFAHAYVAYRLGDNTAAYQGRLTLNPLAHLDPIGSLMLLFIGFGYAKPVPVNPMNLKDPRSDMMKVAFAGPVSNLILCVFGCILMRLIGIENLAEIKGSGIGLNSAGNMLFTFSVINMILAVFNMIPIHPLDGGQIFGGYLDKNNPDLSYKLRAYGPNVLFAIIFIGLFTGVSILGIIFKPFIKLVILMSGLG